MDIKLHRADRIYRPGEKVSGCIVVESQSSMRHNGIKLSVVGQVTLQLSARSIGLFEAFYSSLKPVQLLEYEIEVSPGGKCPSGTTEFPFEFTLKPLPGQELYDTYHGVYVNIQYNLTADMVRGMMAKNLQKQKEFFVELRKSKELRQEQLTAKPFKFQVNPQSLANVKEQSKKRIPDFLFEGWLQHTTMSIDHAMSGEITIKKCKVEIKSVELQLVRVETCTYMDGEAKEATEIQNIQVADGNVIRGLPIPIHMIFPRLFTCSTTVAKAFKVEFEVNLIIVFQDSHMVTENFPIKLFR